MSVGKNIKKLRIKNGLTQEALAEIINVKQSMIAQIERGSKVPSILLSNEIAIVLGCTLEDLVKTG